MNHAAIDNAVAALRAGAVIAYPTEAVWGLGCDPDNVEALERLLALKARHPAKGMILIAGSVSHIEAWLTGLAPERRERLMSSWPGPVTWLVPDNGRTHPLVKGQHDKVALRVSDHPLVRALTEAFGGPIISTSANRSGNDPMRSAEAVCAEWQDDVVIVPGELGGRDRPSVIRDVMTGDVLRA